MMQSLIFWHCCRSSDFTHTYAYKQAENTYQTQGGCEELGNCCKVLILILFFIFLDKIFLLCIDTTIKWNVKNLREGIVAWMWRTFSFNWSACVVGKFWVHENIKTKCCKHLPIYLLYAYVCAKSLCLFSSHISNASDIEIVACDLFFTWQRPTIAATKKLPTLCVNFKRTISFFKQRMSYFIV